MSLFPRTSSSHSHQSARDRLACVESPLRARCVRVCGPHMCASLAGCMFVWSAHNMYHNSIINVVGVCLHIRCTLGVSRGNVVKMHPIVAHMNPHRETQHIVPECSVDYPRECARQKHGCVHAWFENALLRNRKESTKNPPLSVWGAGNLFSQYVIFSNFEFNRRRWDMCSKQKHT